MVLRYQTQMEVPGYKPMDLTGHMLHDDNGDIDRRPTTTKECYHCDSVMSHGFLACQPSYRLLFLPSLSLPLSALGPPGRVLNSGATWLQTICFPNPHCTWGRRASFTITKDPCYTTTKTTKTKLTDY